MEVNIGVALVITGYLFYMNREKKDDFLETLPAGIITGIGLDLIVKGWS